MLPGRLFAAGCGIVAIGIVALGHVAPTSVWLLATEVFATILGLFVFGSFKYQIHKNALTYGLLLVIAATFLELPASACHLEIAQHGAWAWSRRHLLTFAGLDELIH